MNVLDLQPGCIVEFVGYDPMNVQWYLFKNSFAEERNMISTKGTRLRGNETFMIVSKDVISDRDSGADSLIDYKVLYQGTVWYFTIPTTMSSVVHRQFRIHC